MPRNDKEAVGGILALPFVADVPNPCNPRKTFREFWNIPDEADYTEANRIGMRWAAAFIKYSAEGSGCVLPMVARGIAVREARLPEGSGAHGFSVGFFYGLECLAEAGAAAWGGADQWIERTEAYYREAEEKRRAQEQQQIAERVARMNAAKAAKKASRQAA
jgi:hypothetical protein